MRDKTIVGNYLLIMIGEFNVMLSGVSHLALADQGQTPDAFGYGIQRCLPDACETPRA